MIWIVPCVAGCDGPMLTMTASSPRPRRTSGGPDWAAWRCPRRRPQLPVRHERLLLVLRVVLAQRMADEALVEQDRAQVGVAAEDDAVHVVALALHEGGRAVQRESASRPPARSRRHRVFRRTRDLVRASSRSGRRPRSAAHVRGQSTAVTSRSRSKRELVLAGAGTTAQQLVGARARRPACRATASPRRPPAASCRCRRVDGQRPSVRTSS